jgi:DNA-binding LytR/AlgR family response regulator
MNATALIAEDEPLLAQNLLQELAQQWPELNVVASVANGESAVERALALRPEVLFLDIRMPGMTGLEAAQALAEDWPDDAPFPLLVFVTAYDQYAVQAFERQAVDYLLKPVTAERMAQCCARLARTLGERKAAPQAVQHTVDQLRALLANTSLAPPAANAARLEVIQASVGDTVHMVPVDEVIYFEAADKYVRVITAAKEHLIRTSLRELLPRLDAQRFWQVHRGTVVQARCVQSARREESGKVILTLRGRAEKVVASRLYAHLFKGM